MLVFPFSWCSFLSPIPVGLGFPVDFYCPCLCCAPPHLSLCPSLQGSPCRVVSAWWPRARILSDSGGLSGSGLPQEHSAGPHGVAVCTKCQGRVASHLLLEPPGKAIPGRNSPCSDCGHAVPNKGTWTDHHVFPGLPNKIGRYAQLQNSPDALHPHHSLQPASHLGSGPPRDDRSRTPARAGGDEEARTQGGVDGDDPTSSCRVGEGTNSQEHSSSLAVP